MTFQARVSIFQVGLNDAVLQYNGGASERDLTRSDDGFFLLTH